MEQPLELFAVGQTDDVLFPPHASDKTYRVVFRGDAWMPARDIPGTLPAERDRFVGRTRSLKDLAQEISGSRLVTLLGPGGIGKTRLSKRFGHEWAGEFPGGVWFCDLSTAKSLDGLLHGVAAGLDIPLGGSDPVVQLGRALIGRGQCLVILDNFEQIAHFSELTLGRWIELAKEAHFIVTSRQVTGVSGERAYWLEALTDSEGSELFENRASASRQASPRSLGDRNAVVQLVRLLDGLPLAIELAAARARIFSPQSLLQRIGSRLELATRSVGPSHRQSTLRSTFDWSWDLLSDEEKSVLAQLSVFEGSISFEAATQVIGRPDTLQIVENLVEKSLVRLQSEERVELLTTLQEYASEHLRNPESFMESGPAASSSAMSRHVKYFASLGRVRGARDRGVELDNLVAAARRAVAFGMANDATGALEGAWESLRLRGPFRVGVELAELVASVVPCGTAEQARVQCVYGNALRSCGKGSEAQLRFSRALEDARSVEDRSTEGRALLYLGNLHVDAGRIEQATIEFDSAMHLATTGDDLLLRCEVLIGHGNLMEHMGRLAEARTLYGDALGAARRLGNARWEGATLGNLGLLFANQGSLVAARESYEQALDIARELGDRLREGNTLCNLGLLNQLEGRTGDAMAVLEEALTLAKSLGYAQLECIVSCNLGIACESAGAADKALTHFDAARLVAKDIGDRRSEGQCLGYAGLLHARGGRFSAAAECMNEAEELLVAVADRLNLGILMCARSESASLAGDWDLAVRFYRNAASIYMEVDAGDASEFGQSLSRLRSLIGLAKLKQFDAFATEVSVEPSQNQTFIKSSEDFLDPTRNSAHDQ